MATRGSIRDWLRRRLQETTAAQWSDATLNAYINFGYQFTQEEIEAAEPDAFAHYTDKSDLVANQEFYPLPVNAKAPRLVRIKLAAADDYSVIEQIPWINSVPEASEAQQLPFPRYNTTWSLQGRHIKLTPAPSSSVTDGLELTYQPVLTMGDDADVPEMTANYHANIVFFAQIIALGDTANTTDKQAAFEDINLFIARLPRIWQRTIAMKYGTPPITVAKHLKIGPEGTNYSLPNDWDSR